uniref:Cytochrome c oxidase subunit 2 n=1 Tax=Mastigeulota kiangsinensis TaxID=1544384 RepID=A0A0U1XB94_MASKI|nr:cytochrome c oxidase subunit II [Mastigeulota kiangsinensis]AIN75494.1 cytochrome c oxidase subunit II [Mastigeulota kiangsinensis]
MSSWGQLNLLDPGSMIQAEMLLFHDHALMIISGIFTLVSLVGLLILYSNYSTRRVHEAQTLEIFWTVLPALLLITLALPSLRLLYLLDEQPLDSKNTLKSIGHQWFWSYEIPNLGNKTFDSYMTPTTEITSGEYRLLEVDNRVVIPSNVDTSVITTSADVIHAWAVPSLGIKMDSVPGRLNMMNINPLISGVFYGQCSEICGANHAFMPIVVESVPPSVYLSL